MEKYRTPKCVAWLYPKEDIRQSTRSGQAHGPNASGPTHPSKRPYEYATRGYQGCFSHATVNGAPKGGMLGSTSIEW